MWISKFLAPAIIINMSVNCAISVHPCIRKRKKSEKFGCEDAKTKWLTLKSFEPIGWTWIMTATEEKKKKKLATVNCSGLGKCIYRKWYTHSMRCVALLSETFVCTKVWIRMNYLAHVDRIVLCHWKVWSHARVPAFICFAYQRCSVEKW